jgi:hypothetical protein
VQRVNLDGKGGGDRTVRFDLMRRRCDPRRAPSCCVGLPDQWDDPGQTQRAYLRWTTPLSVGQEKRMISILKSVAMRISMNKRLIILAISSVVTCAAAHAAKTASISTSTTGELADTCGVKRETPRRLPSEPSAKVLPRAPSVWNYVTRDRTNRLLSSACTAARRDNATVRGLGRCPAGATLVGVNGWAVPLLERTLSLPGEVSHREWPG